MKVLIVEDEDLAAERLIDQIKSYDDQIECLGPLDTIKETVSFLRRNHQDIDLIFLDIQLADGKSFEIFQEINLPKPVIFTTAYDEYAIDAFRLNSIDYLLKPIAQNDLKAALDKYFHFAQPPLPSSLPDALIHDLVQRKKYKERFLVKSGQRMFFLQSTDVDHFIAQDKLCYLVEHSDKRKFLIDYTLEQLQDILDPSKFYRISRSAIIQIGAIREIRPLRGNRLCVKTIECSDNTLVVSRSRVSDFKKWLQE